MNNTVAFLILLTLTASVGAVSNSAPTTASPVSSARPKSQATQVPTDATRQAKVDTLLKVSGMATQLDMLSDEMVVELAGPAAQDSKVSAAKVQMEALARKAFPAGRFSQVAREILLKHYDAAGYDRYIAISNEPQTKRLTEMESAQIKPEALTAYLKGLQANPMAISRVKLIEAIDQAGHASQHRIELVTSLGEAIAMASLGACPTKSQVAQVKDGLAKVKEPIRKQSEEAVRIALAYTYRNASDADLEYLLKASRDGIHQKINTLVWDAIQHEMKSGFAMIAETVRTTASNADRQKTVFAQRSCDGKSLLPPPGYAKSAASATMQTPSISAADEQSKTVVEAKQAQTIPPARDKTASVALTDASVKGVTTPTVARDHVSETAKPRRNRSNADARECLKLEDIKKVMACAEKYR